MAKLDGIWLFKVINKFTSLFNVTHCIFINDRNNSAMRKCRKKTYKNN